MIELVMRGRTWYGLKVRRAEQHHRPSHGLRVNDIENRGRIQGLV
jgi:hypothetical protein